MGTHTSVRDAPGAMVTRTVVVESKSMPKPGEKYRLHSNQEIQNTGIYLCLHVVLISTQSGTQKTGIRKGGN